ncbi:DUF6114 domain-containing protein [Streptomyces sp. BPTC-684]|uniref:DUF6114 domain-containing protein n=1 Tax=Streptomyces sp. BPTC-684 TaxID=3043734 RepID=UPI0024B1F2C0|nr:DUF6114 domain-containing protein [Streptomyces sp. BPTC-684]WHM36536.1 DUF6114 domain-containing protein [Streptomyces sp. BPTC-684]
MSAETTGSRGFTYWRLRFRAWRGGRPFWAGVFTMAGGVPIMYFPYANMHLGNITLAMSTTAGAGSLIIGVLLVTLGLTMWFHHVVRVFAGIAAILLALISLPVANFGGFVMGFLFALFGGALAVAWVPAKPRRRDLRAQRSGDPSGDEPDGGTVPGPREEEPGTAVTETTVDANGGRNSAG